MSAPPPRSDPNEPPRDEPHAGRPSHADADQSAQHPPPPDDAEAGARTPDEYTEAPGSHRRPGDGAALDVGG